MSAIANIPCPPSRLKSNSASTLEMFTIAADAFDACFQPSTVEWLKCGNPCVRRWSGICGNPCAL
ncbi:hypothetical protein B0H11DRAFT_2225927 [Mycena galericulata]|nr:hypothetical protein B0H11DRAFT_2234513 [Mycena galericulata]KAJ7498288.1 hypothetical protein B0H11DRAFT_2225927 [Mycena galericulata]